jgi:hypothetical protein
MTEPRYWRLKNVWQQCRLQLLSGQTTQTTFSKILASRTGRGGQRKKQRNDTEPINGSDAFVRHAGCWAAGAPSLARINSTFDDNTLWD